MNDTYNEFSGTDLDQDADYDADFAWDDEEGNDLLPILGLSAALAAVVGAILVLMGRRRQKTPMEKVEAFMGDVGKEAKKGAKKVSRSVGDMKLGDMLSDALDRAGDAAGDVDLSGFAGDVKKRARKLTRDIEVGSMLEDALDQAKRAAKRLDLDDRTRDVRKKVSKAASRVPTPDVDTKGVENLLESLVNKLAGAIESVRSDVAPKAVEHIREDVVPAAQDAMQKVRDDVLPNVGERAGKLMDDAEVGKRARRVASTAGQGALSLADFARGLAASVMHKVVQDALPEMKKMGGKVVDTAREDVLPKVGEMAAQTPDALGSLLSIAREKAEEAMDKAGPMAEDAATYGRHRLSDFATFSRHRASDVAEGIGPARDGIGSVATGIGGGVAGAVGGATSAVKHGVGSAVGATKYATREGMGILFWLAALGGLILLVFVPEKKRQSDIFNGALQFINEVREMWTDLQGPDYAPEDADEADARPS